MGKVYWFVPLKQPDGTLIGGERVVVEEEKCQELLKFFKKVHPRLLVPFKVSLLFQGEGSEACGSDSPLAYSLPSREVVLDGKPYAFSACAKQWLSRLVPPHEALVFVQAADEAVLWEKMLYTDGL